MWFDKLTTNGGECPLILSLSKGRLMVRKAHLEREQSAHHDQDQSAHPERQRFLPLVYHHLKLERDGQVAVVTLNRPETLNAINQELHLEIMEACRELAGDDAIRAVVWTGEGRGFSSGVDLKADRSSEEPAPRQQRLDQYNWVGRQAITMYRALDKPTIAAVNGVAAGAGMSMALACDLRVGCDNTRFKTVFVERNLSPDSGMSYFLPRIVGASRAFDLVFTSRIVEAEEAYRIGLLDRLTSADRLLEDAKELAREIAFWPPLAVQMSKRVLQHSLEATLEDQLQYETHAIQFTRRAPHDVEEAAASFRERRPPNFTGE